MPWTVSVCAHAALIIIGFFVVWTALPDAPGSPRTTIISFATKQAAPTPVTASIDAAATARPDRATPTAPPAPMSPMPTMAEALAAPELSTPMAPMDSMGIEAPALPEIVPPAGVRFFGVGATDVRSIVYVVDASGSMVTTFPYILDELERSASALDALQRFQVIFFKGEAGNQSGRVAAPDPKQPGRTKETRLIRCTPESVRAVIDWARGVRPGGRSDPMEALRVAINLRPDAIIMLSSSIAGTGQWEVSAEEVLTELEALNPVDRRTGRRPISILTVQMIDEDPSGLLRAIGEHHGPPGGGHRFIDRRELQQ